MRPCLLFCVISIDACMNLYDSDLSIYLPNNASRKGNYNLHMYSMFVCSYTRIMHCRAGQTVGFCIQTDHVWGIVLRALKDKTDAAAGGKARKAAKDENESAAPVPKTRILKVCLHELGCVLHGVYHNNHQSRSSLRPDETVKRVALHCPDTGNLRTNEKKG
jgi:hypothetical protein